ncbi:PREDICTED: E3 ISG15--protein ligase HERC5-like isoform X1 [Crocodylus porosus]|uniref:E3 ISG15--protein ligase HERC5-like isoform X1 n=1 Tax=Crocodylus porosus TaxID=8502 RepID=UPI00093EB209|nr:PREDICTED: E3 ISG15--protein ligase HERC5-like isoform X1 [Crocodylus porosus]
MPKKMPRDCQTPRHHSKRKRGLLSPLPPLPPLPPPAAPSSSSLPSLFFFPMQRCHPSLFKKCAQEIRQIHCKQDYFAVVEKNGSVLIFDQGDERQGHPRKPRYVNLRKNTRVDCLDTEATHMLILSLEGKLFEHSISTTTNKSEIRLLEDLVNKPIVQIACGDHHSMALSKGGELFTWGNNSHGQLGSGSQITFLKMPQLVKDLQGIPVAQIAAGGAHCLVLSLSGAVYSWGKNSFGQLGLGHTKDMALPQYITALEHKKTVFVSCGGEHSAVLSKDGLVCTFGAGGHGQLGHNSTRNELTPRLVAELFGAQVSQIACGGWHTLVYVSSLGKIYAFGSREEGQLGSGDKSSQLIPLPLKLPLNEENGRKHNQENGTSGNEIKIIAEGNQSIVLFLKEKDPYINLNGIAVVNNEKLDKWISCSDAQQWEHIKKNIRLIFSSVACVNGSFLEKRDKLFGTSHKISGVDVSEVLLFYEKIKKKPRVFQQVIKESEKLLKSLPSSSLSPEALGVYLIMPVLLQDDQSNQLLGLLAEAIWRLQHKDLQVLESLWSNLETPFFKDLVNLYQKLCGISLSRLIIQAKTFKELTYGPQVEMTSRVLQILYQVNCKVGFKVQEKNFYVPEVKEIWWQDWCTDPFLYSEEFERLIASKSNQMVILQKLTKYPCIFDMKNKIEVHKVTCQWVHFSRPTNPLVLHIRREHLVNDALQTLRLRVPTMYGGPLKVIFHGEPGTDGGGLSREFFRIITKELCEPKAQIFRRFECSNLIWFPSEVPGHQDIFHLIGVLSGMALFNFHKVPFPFPLALYKKILGIPLSLEDLRELSPTEGSNLQKMLDEEYDDILEEMMLDFTVMKKEGEAIVTVELKENGANIPITKHNRKEYVDAYVNYVFNESVKKPFKDFMDGFLRGCPANSWRIFLPTELQTVFRGHTKYDWQLLEKNANYINYEKTDQTIKNFWAVFHELPEEKKKNFLVFLTGTDRIPAEGMDYLILEIDKLQKENPDEYYPMANTCSHILGLPNYSSEEILREKFLIALENYEKFGLS